MNTIKNYSVLHVYTDGASRGNPGKAAAAFVINSENEELLHESATYLGIATNNSAEYTGLLNSLTWLIENANTSEASIHFFSDSELMVKQLNGIYKIREPHIAELADKIKTHLTRLKDVSIKHIPRSQNKRADQLCNQCLDTLS